MLFLPFIILVVFTACIIKNKTWAFCFYMVCRLLLPPIVRVGPVSMNTFMSFIMLATIILSYKKLDRQQKKMFFPIGALILPLGIFSFFGVIPYDIVYRNLFQFFMTEICPCLFLIICLKSSKDVRQILLFIGLSYIIVGIWGIITYLLKMNPLYTFFMLTFAGDYEVSDFTGDGFGSLRGSLLGAASGNLSGPLPWGQESMLVALFFLFFKDVKKNPKYLIITIVVLAVINTFLSGKRSCLLPIIIFYAFYFWRSKLFSLKNVFLSIFVLVTAFIVISSFPIFNQINKNIESTIFFWDDNVARKNNVDGSSLEMRQSQFECANQMISNHVFCGLGYDYPSYYSSIRGLHPVMFGFESIYFSVIVSSGLLGLLVWFLFFRRIILLSYKNKNDLDFILAYHFGFLLSCLLTAIQSSLWIYMIFSYLYVQNKKCIKKEKVNEVINSNSSL